MNKPLDVFFSMPCLTEQSVLLNGIALQRKWFKSTDKRYIGQALQKLIDYNASGFNFIGVTPFILGSDQSASLAFRSSEFIGAIPLRAPDTGKQIGDFVILPRFIGSDKFENYIEILNLLGKEISPVFKESIPLASGSNFRPPLYLEAVKFINAIEHLVKTHWTKFNNIEKFVNHPAGEVNWNKYIAHEYKVENRLKFPTRKNILSEFHKEYSEIRYVFDICKLELQSSNTPFSIRSKFRERLSFLEEKLYMHKPLPTTNIILESADSLFVKNCKELANKILNFKLVESTAWKVDFSDVFEKLVQYIFKETAKETGGRLIPNVKFRSKSALHFSWELKHIEPDAVYQKNDTVVFIDAKYKSNLYNKFSKSENLKIDHRHDLHQILAYSSFSKSDSKFGILCYPSDILEIKKTTFATGVNSSIGTILILGIPLKVSIVNEAKKMLTKELMEIERMLGGSESGF